MKSDIRCLLNFKTGSMSLRLINWSTHPVPALRLIVIFLLIFYALPSSVFAAVSQFVPKISDYSGSLEVDATYDSNQNSVSGRNANTKDLYLKQMLDLSASGYVYHPRFILFSLRLAAGLQEEDFSSGGSGKFRTGSADEYEVRAMVLPEHPYNLELFDLKLEPLAKGGLSEPTHSVSYSRGAIFRYKKKPYFLNVHYLNTSSESAVTTNSTTKYGFLGTYYKELREGKTYSFSASYDHQTFNSSESRGTSDEAALSNALVFKVFRLSSGLMYHNSTQDSHFQRLSVSNMGGSWIERGQVFLPWNFSSDLSYGLTKESFEVREPSVATTKVSNTTNNAAFSLNHKLYDSLTSAYSLGYGSSTSEFGNSSSFSQGLSFAYKKKIPYGQLRANISISSSNSDSKGVQSIANEVHNSVAVPGRFTLGSDDVNIDTITVWLNSPTATGELLLLQQNADYVIIPFGKTAQIQILNLPAQFLLPGNYNFVVSYSLNQQDAKFRTDNLNYSVATDLFSGRFSPYYNHTETKQTESGGSADFVPINISTDAFGFLLTWRPVTLSAEYSVIDSNIDPSRGWKANLNYNDNIFQNTQLQAGALVSSTFYPNGTNQLSAEGYTDNLMGLSLGVQQRIPKRLMFLFLGGSYTHDKGLGQTTTYSLNSSFVWKVGKLFITAGGNAGFSDSSINGLESKRAVQSYYLTVKRKLF